ncbi:hydroxyacid dehydrogenase, partial [Candidatus Pacearchaeota archaeon]
MSARRQKRMKIAFFEIKGWEKKIIRSALSRHKVLFFSEPLSEENVAEVRDADVISVFIYSKLTKSLLGKLRAVKVIATRSTGFDHIDLGECKRRGVSVYNVPSYGENTVAEHTFALILA